MSKVVGKVVSIALACLLNAFNASASVSGTIVAPGGGEIAYANAESAVKLGDGSVLLTFTKTTLESTFTFPGLTMARILAVGGGGGGGGIYRNGGVSPYGGGAGGGAGGFVEVTNLYLAATYAVSVGAGGAGGANGTSATANLAGGDGEPTTVTTNGVDVARALGGGGGGGQSNGHAAERGMVGSGGGGSQRRNPSATSVGIPGEPGLGTEGQGHNGGAGDAAVFGGGGGGAGKAGAAASTGNPVGGDGLPSDITGKEEWYAGGGGGADSARTPTGATAGIAGGKGGGGQGGCGRAPAEGGKAKSGDPGTGGGGGGAAANSGGQVAGNGGSGIVYVRVEASVVGSLEKPQDVFHEYDGLTHTAVSPSPFFEILGENEGVDVGVYVATVKPVQGLLWSDGTDDEVTVTMTIGAAGSITGVEEVTGTSVSYCGAAEKRWLDNGDGTKDLLLKFTDVGSFSLPGTAHVRILAIGGGGGGGGIYRNGGVSPYGGGGGGGAGGMVDDDSLMSEGNYVVSVGLGGAAARNTSSSGGTALGENGGDTLVTKNGDEILVAYGGGGGGGQCEGSAGGSGGGGSAGRTGVAGAGGGALDPLQGCSGGAGDAALTGGGGGGAGAVGFSASKLGVGGAGRASDITGVMCYYAGGGGGGNCDKSIVGATSGIAGGLGGGGQGGVGRSPAAGGAATDGVDGTGGGGGGAGDILSQSAGSGGSGIVYVRISSAMRGEFAKPASSISIEYDGRKHVSCENTVFYDVVGENVGTDVGTYVAMARLRPGICWPDGTAEDVVVTMTIVKRPALISDLHLELNGAKTEGWTFGDENVPHPVCVVEPAWAQEHVVFEYRAQNADVADAWSSECPTNAGAYYVRARVADEKNFDCPAVSCPFTMAKRQVSIGDLRIRNWMAGTPDESTPDPICTVEPSWAAVVYEYADCADATDWSPAKPSAIGTHFVRVRVADADNCDGEPSIFPFAIRPGLGNVYSDYVELTLAGTESKLAGFPCKLTLSESSPIGFSYARAGETGDDLTFTDANGNVLDYVVETWNVAGESTVYVKIPEIGLEPQTIRLFWHVRDGAAVPARNPNAVWSEWSHERQSTVVQPAVAFGVPASVDGFLIDHFTRYPVLSKTMWKIGEEPGRILQEAALAYGPVMRRIVSLTTGAEYADIPCEGGAYRLSYASADSLAYAPIECHVDFSILESRPLDNLMGDAKSLTLSGRVLLANDDVVSGHEVVGQGYWQTREVVTNALNGATLTNDVFWVHGTEEHGFYQNDVTASHMLPGTTHKLCYVAADVNGSGEPSVVKTLWRCQDVIVGNTITDDRRLYSMQCALPWSPTGLGISSYGNRNVQGDMLEAGNLILRNVTSAVVWSPCYTNGIGTVYFDAVNGDSNQVDPDRLVVEIATMTSEGLVPTDENAKDDSRSDFGGELGMITSEQWRPMTILPFYYDGTAFTSQVPTNEFALANAVGRSTNRFYRLVVPVNVRGPARFRIRRTTVNPNRNEDNGGLILLDNVIVSQPSATVDLVPYGAFDASRSGRFVLGQETAMMTPFPSISDETVFGRAKPVVYAPEGTVPRAAQIVAAKMHYRWRYLDQACGDWQSVDLLPGDEFRSAQPLNLPRQEGDVEFWFESLVNAPYYQYFDYSGTGLGMGGLYTEEVQTVTNRQTGAGRDWFVRLRKGQSDYEGFRLVTEDNRGTATVEMELVSDHMWRGCLRMQGVAKDQKVKVRFEGVNLQVPGDGVFRQNLSCLAMESGNESIPFSTKAVTCDPTCWSTVAWDAVSGNLCFTLNDQTHELSVSHAECQDFNHWVGARRSDGLFVGQSQESGTTCEYKANMEAWPLSESTRVYWQEPFVVDQPAMQPGGPFEIGQNFRSGVSPNGFAVGAGMWVPGYYADLGTGMAYQMEANGNGFIRSNWPEAPRGIESVCYTARIGQNVTFDDFARYDAGGRESRELTNYTFFCRAAYDVFKRTSFAGNASLSLATFYRAGVGCYELRVEQANAKYVDSTMTGPGNGHRLSLYRWQYDDASQDVRPVLLGSQMISNSNAAMLTTDGERGNYALLFMSVKDTGAATEICAGVSTSCARVESVSSATCSWLAYVDDSAARHVNGTYGVLSANCPARFRYLHYSPVAQICPTKIRNKFYSSIRSFAFPSASVRVPCREDLANGGWIVQSQRIQFIDVADPVNFGLAAADVAQTLDVYVAPEGTEQWKLVGSQTVSGFGESAPATWMLYDQDAGAVKIVTGGEGRVSRTEIVLDDLSVRSWGADSYDDKRGQRDFADVGYGSPENVVYTHGWIMSDDWGRRLCRLSARRTRPGSPASIRSPLMDGQNGRGRGLGMLAFSYANAQANARLLVQVATNGVSVTNLKELTAAGAADPRWVTVDMIDFSTLTEIDRANGMRTCYLGLQNACGVARIVVDPSVTSEVSSELDPAKFGEVDIRDVVCRDDPAADARVWSGWNMRTTDELDKLTVADGDGASFVRGLSLALNNSTVDGVPMEEQAICRAHSPYVQTPTADGDVFNEIRFVARRYDLADPMSRITLFGLKEGSGDVWSKLTSWTVTNSLFEPYAFKAVPGDAYCAFRLAVTGVVDDRTMPDDDPLQPPSRVLIDDVVALESERTIAEAEVRLLGDLTYTGADQSQDIQVSVGGVALRPGVDYTVSGNVAAKVGRYELTVTGLGAFHGEKKVSYRIDRADLTREKVRVGEPPRMPTEVVWTCGFEDCAEGALPADDHFAVSDDAQLNVSLYESLARYGYGAVPPAPFEDCGEKCLTVKTSFGDGLDITAGEIGFDSNEGAYFDALVQMTAFDEEPDFGCFMANSRQLLNARTGLVPGRTIALRAPRGYMLSIDDKLAIYPMLRDAEDDYSPVDLCLAASRYDGQTGRLEDFVFKLEYEGGFAIPDLDSAWHRITVALKKEFVEGLGDVAAFRVFVDGLPTCAQSGESTFFCRRQDGAFCLSRVTAEGQGRMDDIVFAKGSPEPLDGIVYSVQADGKGHMLPVSIVGEGDCEVRYSLTGPRDFVSGLLLTNEVSRQKVWYEVSSVNYYRYVGSAFMSITPHIADPIPDIGENPSEEDVRTALAGSNDPRLEENIVDGKTYASYRTWALRMQEDKGVPMESVKASATAWGSFAMDCDGLLPKMPTDDDLKVEEFKPSATAGSFDFTVSVEDVTIGDKASEDNLKKLFGLEGAESLDSAAFSSENVALDFKEPQDGKLKFTATPAVDNAKSFFMKVKVK